MSQLSARAALALFLLTSSALAQEPIKIKLRFELEGERPETWKPAGSTIAIGQVTDARGAEDPTVIGESQVKGAAAIPVVASSPVTGFVEQAIFDSLKKWKVNVSADAGQVLRSEILEFSALARKRCAATVRIRFFLEDRAGQVVWQGEIANDDSTGLLGKIDTEENFIQVLCTATQRVVAGLFDDKGFRAALTKKAN